MIQIIIMFQKVLILQIHLDGEVRIKEFKEMVKTLHKAGISVVMDVVYNHTYSIQDSNEYLAVPGYYYRQDARW